MQLVECPRDALQGITEFVPTSLKIKYLNALLKVGFDVLDFGSFVSPKAIPQMADTAEALAGLEDSPTKLLAIVGNLRGGTVACGYERVNYVGFPLSVSEIFQQRNTNKTITVALEEVAGLQALCEASNKTLTVYLSMAFGNPYEETYSEDTVVNLTEKLLAIGVKSIVPSDTIGSSTPSQITKLTLRLAEAFPKQNFGLHLHSTPAQAREKIQAALSAPNISRLDGALRGFGGCPMAKDTLTGNIPTELVISILEEKSIKKSIRQNALFEALQLSEEVFG